MKVKNQLSVEEKIFRVYYYLLYAMKMPIGKVVSSPRVVQCREMYAIRAKQQAPVVQSNHDIQTRKALCFEPTCSTAVIGRSILIFF